MAEIVCEFFVFNIISIFQLLQIFWQPKITINVAKKNKLTQIEYCVGGKRVGVLSTTKVGGFLVQGGASGFFAEQEGRVEGLDCRWW